MPQVTIQPVTEAKAPIGSPIPLEVASLDVGRKSKLRTYSRVQAYSDTSLIVGAYNRTYNFSVAVPQDFTVAEDIESLLAGLQYQMQLFTDPEGYGDYVRIQEVSPVHTGGQPYYYTVDVTAVSMGFPFILPTPPSPEITPADELASPWPIFFYNNNWWIFYTVFSGGTYSLYYTSSSGGAWKSPVLVHTPAANNFEYAVYFDGSNVHIGMFDYPGTPAVAVYYRRGIPQTSGAISWLQPEQTVYTNATYSGSPAAFYVSADSNRHPWVVFRDATTNYQAYMSATTDGTWSTTLTHSLGDASLGLEPTSIGGGHMVFSNSSASGLGVSYYNGSIWQTWSTVGVFGGSFGQLSANIGGGNVLRVHFVFSFPAHLGSFVIDTGALSNISKGKVFGSDPTTDFWGVCLDALHNQVYVFWLEASSASYYNRYHIASGTWDATATLNPAGNNIALLQGQYQAYNGTILIPYISSRTLHTYAFKTS